MKIELNSSVYSDLVEIMEHYDELTGPDLAAEFYAEFRHYTKEAAARPFSFAEHRGELRKAGLSRFPYQFLFRVVNESSIRILVPSFGLDRE